MEYNEQISHINSLLQEIETKIVYMQDNVKKVNSSSTSNSADINSVNEQLNSLKNTVNNLQTNVSNLQYLANSNNSQIQSINATLTTLQNQIATLEQSVNSNTANITTLEQNVSTNTNSISTINTTIEQINNSLSLINTQIEQLQNSSTSSCDCEEQMTAISTKVTSMETIVNNFTTLIKDRNRAIDTTFTQIDPETVVQTYDCMEKIYDYTGTSTYHSGLFEFCVQEGTTACTLKIILSMICKNSSVAGKANFNLYLNGSSTPITKEIVYRTLYLPITLTFDLPITTAGNFFYFTVNTTNSVTMHFTKAKAEVLNCTNPIFLNKVCPFSVDYFNGTYYLTDCTGEYAKIAQINASDIATISDVTWTETTYKAMAGITSGMLNTTAKPYSAEYVARFYLKSDGKIYCDNPITNTTIASAYNYHYTFLSPTFMQSSSFYCLSVSCPANSKTYTVLRHSCSKTGSTNQTSFSDASKQIALVIGGRTNVDFLQTTFDPSTVAYQYLDGTFLIRSNSAKFNLGKGVVKTFYAQKDNPNILTLYVYVYGKIIKYKLQYLSSPYRFELLSTTTVGNYDNYFEGANDDYFVVKDNKLYYYKNNLQPLVS